MTQGGRLDDLNAQDGGLEFGFSVPNLLLLALMPLGALVIAFGPYLVIFGTTDRTSWRLRAPATGTELQIGVYMGGCDDFEGLSVSETDSVVHIAAYVRAHDACGDDILLFEPKSVQLSAPLGDRALRGCNPSNSVYKESGYSDNDCAATYPH